MGFSIPCALVFFAITSNADLKPATNCRAANGQRGQCLPLYSCKYFVNILESNLDSEYWNEKIVSYSCGFQKDELMVCCPEPNLIGTPTLFSRNTNLDLLPKECGHIDLETKIVDGNKTGLFEFPWMARLLYNTSAGLKFNCGGTIINDRYILTAAHCVLAQDRRELIGVRVGDHNYQNDIDCDSDGECAPPPQNFQIENIIAHPEFESKSTKNDISLIKVKTRIMFNDTVQPICLPLETMKNNMEGSYGFVTGWGVTENGTESPELLQAKLQVKSLRECQNLYGMPSITENHLCVGGTSRSNSCFGDSGGPFQQAGKIKNEVRMVQQGIVSFGLRHNNCTLMISPVVYVKVASYVKWILNEIDN